MATHLQLWNVCRDTESYKNGTDTNNHEKPDCSCGCKHFHPLEGKEGADWGVCACPDEKDGIGAPRKGLLTFEHMGCDFFEYDPQLDDEEVE